MTIVSFLEKLQQLEKSAVAVIQTASKKEQIDQIKSQFLGKKSGFSELLPVLATLTDPAEKKQLGAAINATKSTIENSLSQKQQELAQLALDEKLNREVLDATLPPAPYAIGKLHPIGQVGEEIIAILAEMGFQLATGPEIETDWFNFTALNVPPAHPARQMQDTFYLDQQDTDGNPYLLRTHTSSVQIRAGLQHVKKHLSEQKPLRLMARGRVYRSDSDLTHTPMFHQVEGLVLEPLNPKENWSKKFSAGPIHFGHLKGCLLNFCRAFFEIQQLDDELLRFRPSYFPFTEPSAEVDIACIRQAGNFKFGRDPKSENLWLEILGSGMVHPTVIQNIGLDPTQWQGFAFGMGVERLAMLKYGMPDLRQFFESDVRWLDYYGFKPYATPSLITSLVAG